MNCGVEGGVGRFDAFWIDILFDNLQEAGRLQGLESSTGLSRLYGLGVERAEVESSRLRAALLRLGARSFGRPVTSNLHAGKFVGNRLNLGSLRLLARSGLGEKISNRGGSCAG